MVRMTKKERRIQEAGYAVNAILSKAKKSDCKIIGLTSCLGLEREIQWLCEKCNIRSKEKGFNIVVKELKSVINYAEALEEAKNCDAIVMVERYAITTYKMVEKMKEYLDREELKLLGVVSVQ